MKLRREKSGRLLVWSDSLFLSPVLLRDEVPAFALPVHKLLLDPVLRLLRTKQFCSMGNSLGAPSTRYTSTVTPSDTNAGITPSLQWHPAPRPNSQWVRPLEEEGIEPHPGPRLIGRNVNGLASQDRFNQCVRSVASEHQRDTVAAVFIQEHNLKPSSVVYARLHARRHHRILWLSRYAPTNSAHGKGHGPLLGLP